MAAEGKVIGKSGLLHEGPNENQQSTTKLVEKPCHKRALQNFADFKQEKGSPPTPLCNVVPLFELHAINNKHPNFEWLSGEKGCGLFCSLKCPF